MRRQGREFAGAAEEANTIHEAVVLHEMRKMEPSRPASSAFEWFLAHAGETVPADFAGGIANVDLLDTLQADAGRYEAAHVISFVQALVTCRERLEANVQARIALDAMLVTAPRAASSAR